MYGKSSSSITGNDVSIGDIDSATSLEPNDVLELLDKNNIEYDDYAMQYGSIIAYPLDKKVQITANVIETLKPSITLANRSLPVLSVPSKCRPPKPSGFVGGLF